MMLFSFEAQTQIFTSNSSLFFIGNGAIVQCNGGVLLTNGTDLTNEGAWYITKNSTFPNAGSFENISGSIVDGDGVYYIEQDWINDATFNASASVVELYGNTEQLITSTNGTITEFNDLVLTGSGAGNDRKKTLSNIDARISSNGTLTINNRELATEINSFSVLNPASSAITNTQTFGAEGFVSSLTPGYLNWETNSTNTYLFPTGSSDGTLRYRPIVIQPTNSNANSFGVRLNNNVADLDGYFLAQHVSEISSANTNYYHSIEHTTGTSTADVSLSYLPAVDEDWFASAQWVPGQAEWVTTANNSNASIGNYSSVQISAWDFQDPFHPYVLVNLNEELIIPNIFTPNEDGVNDEYLITAVGLKEFNITIVNRWGQVVFESDDVTKSWDGTFNGTMCSEGTYFYLIKAKSSTKDFDKHGHLTLIEQ